MQASLHDGIQVFRWLSRGLSKKNQICCLFLRAILQSRGCPHPEHSWEGRQDESGTFWSESTLGKPQAREKHQYHDVSSAEEKCGGSLRTCWPPTLLLARLPTPDARTLPHLHVFCSLRLTTAAMSPCRAAVVHSLSWYEQPLSWCLLVLLCRGCNAPSKTESKHPQLYEVDTWCRCARPRSSDARHAQIPVITAPATKGPKLRLLGKYHRCESAPPRLSFEQTPCVSGYASGATAASPGPAATWPSQVRFLLVQVVENSLNGNR